MIIPSPYGVSLAETTLEFPKFQHSLVLLARI